MRKLKREIFGGMAGVVVCVLAIVRCAHPELAEEQLPSSPTPSEPIAEEVVPAQQTDAVDKDGKVGMLVSGVFPSFKDKEGNALKHKIYSVPSYRGCFPDLQEVHIVEAKKWGVSPVQNREEAERRKDELVFVGSNPYYVMDKKMNHSIPYLVPRASDLLQKISRNFLDSLAIKGIPLHTLIVTSVLRTEDDVKRLRRFNTNASEESCHRYGTTFDISYNRYETVTPPDCAERRPVRSDSLKWVLSEVLRDLRKQELCYIKYEVKQGCFHITTR